MPYFKKSSIVFVSLSIIVFLIAPSCDSPNGPGSGLPGITASSPKNNSSGQDLNITLEWEFSDSLTADIGFKVFFGTAGSPPLVDTGLTETKFTPGVLNKNTVYYWRVQAIDSGGIVSTSPVYKFMTGNRFTYPLKIGYSWKYLQTERSINVDPPELAVPYGYDYQYFVFAEIKGQVTLSGSIETFALHSWSTDTAQTWSTRESIAFINNTDSGLCFYAYEGPSMITPKTRVDDDNLFYRFKGRTYDRIEDLISFEKALIEHPSKAAFNPAIVYENPPIYSLHYPLQDDRQWTYRTEDNPWRIDKRAIRWVDLETPAGTFECLQIKWLWDIDGDGEWDGEREGNDYVGPQGLIKRAYLFTGIEIYSYDTPNEPLGTMDVINEYELIEYTLD